MPKRPDGPRFYIYEHFDPSTNEVVYIGCGSYDRAWHFSRSRPAHAVWMREQYDKHGPGACVRIREVGMLYKEALTVERQRIENSTSRFNQRGYMVRCGKRKPAPRHPSLR